MIYTTRPKALATAGFLATVWVVAAAAQPTSTYHLAPLLMAGSIPVVAGASAWSNRLTDAVVGAGLATAVAVALDALGWMLGPTLLPYGGALAEALTFGVIGSVAGALLTTVNARMGQQVQTEYQRPETSSR